MSEAGGLMCKEFCTLSHSKEFAEDTLDHSESLPLGATEFCGLDSLWCCSPNSSVTVTL